MDKTQTTPGYYPLFPNRFINGYEVCRQIKQDEQHREIPIIFISALDDGLDKAKAFSAGGIDYITKPFETLEVLSRIETHLQIKAARTKLHQLNLELEQRVLERTAELNEAKQALEHRAWHDPLTDLPNRAWLMRQIKGLIGQAQQDPTFQFAVLFLDCDRFKVVNDSLGHMVGDHLLVEVAQRITDALPSNAKVARFGGDEFIIVLEEIQHLDEATHLAQQLQDALVLPIHIDIHEMFMSASIGIVLGNHGAQEPEDLVRNADIAMYRAKSLGKARHYVFNTELYNTAYKRLQLETDLRRAVDLQEFFLHYQPIVSLQTGKIEGFEALVRWNHPKRGFISPADFIPIAEETGLIVPLGRWVLEEACRQFQVWQAELGSTGDLTQADSLLKMSVNLSVKQFLQPRLIDTIDQILERTSFDGRNLNLEITESALIDDPQSASLLLEELGDRHIQLAIDDFGTGYSSLSYLHNFPVNTLKIDRSFVNRLDSQGNGLRIIEAMVAMARSLDISVVAEGIETSVQAFQLQQLGCGYAQGYWFAKPLNSASAWQLLLSYPTFEIVDPQGSVHRA